MTKRLIVVFLGLILLSFCAPKDKIEFLPPAPELEQRIAAAGSLFQKGCYTSLKQAFQVYAELYGQPSIKKKISPKMVRTSLLLTLREKELGIASNIYFGKALELTNQDPSLKGFLPSVEVAGMFLVRNYCY